MTNKMNDGGRAFPGAEYVSPHEGNVLHSGMSLRDWFAGQALSGMLSPERRGGGGSESSNSVRAISRDAYRLADAMIEARKRDQQ
jgi:hypothetical protein